jgi:hypothetical protein
VPDADPRPRRWQETVPLFGVLLAVGLIGVLVWRRQRPVPPEQRPAQLGEADGEVVALHVHLEVPAGARPGAPTTVVGIVENPGSRPLADVTLTLEPPPGTRADPKALVATWATLEAGELGRHEVAMAFETEGAVDVRARAGDAGGGARGRAIARVHVAADADPGERLAPVLEEAALVVTRGPLVVRDDAPFEITVVVESRGTPLVGLRLAVEADQGLVPLAGADQPRAVPRLEAGVRWWCELQFLPRRAGRHMLQVVASTPDGGVRAVGVHALRVTGGGE